MSRMGCLHPDHTHAEPVGPTLGRVNNSTLRRTASAALAVISAIAAVALAPLPATAAPVTEPTVAYTQDFSGAGLPEGFNAVEGDWKVDNGRLYGTSATTSQLSRITFGPHLENYRFEATVRFENVLNAGRWSALGMDIQPDGTVPYWIATMRSGTTAANGLEFAERTAANSWNVTDTTAAPTAAGTGTDVKVAVEVRGRKAAWYFNGQKMMETNRLIRTDTGVLGIVNNGATVSYDDITVTQLPDTESLLVGDGGRPAVIAHRGLSSVVPENTLQALLSGGRAGADWVEMDVNTSADGVPVVIHDGSVDRTTAGTGNVSDLTSGYIAGLEAGSWFAPAYAGAKVPTLAEFLDQSDAEGSGILLEVKGPETRAEVQRIIDMVRERGLQNHTILQSFDTNVLQYAREYAPTLRLGLLRGTLDADVVAAAKQYGVVTYNPNWSALAARPGAIKELHDAGIAVMPYTVDSAEQWKVMTQAGVDGIITNRAGALVGYQSAAASPAPTVSFPSGADGATYGRGTSVVPAVVSSNAGDVALTLDGNAVEEGAAVATNSLAPGTHTLTATATGAGGVATAEITFTVAPSVSGLYLLAVSEGADSKVRDKLLKLIDKADWAALAAEAELASGPGLPAEVAALMAADARLLAG
ncbi:glycerophosphodiester phosphodiesterase family protein [Pseudarthrobacter sp. J64]|uniref:glycerophosphodiester phosphodiesterase n=1 Tax=Pseudarthrobacter sp. J64 TaxID=3116485 RepID=UPI002E802A37|nr:glycerophosphodiester phosphodiesterase family protein [Pseudarthrobacter sp. J64]MEE2569816.1 glycerophosphodiester phosphodiesterase family protein [Pseudarthrobacter sp. J64]